MRSEILWAERYGSSFVTSHYSWILWLMVMHLLQSLLCLACFYETKFHLAISKCGVKYFEQPAMDLCLQLIKAQNSWILWLMDVSGCLTLLLLKCPCSQTCQLRSAKWCYVSYFQRLEICMQIRSVNFRKVTRTWFATRVFIFRPPETLLCVMHVNSFCLPFLTSHANLQFFGPR